MHSSKILSPKRKWYGRGKQQGKRGSYTKQFSSFTKVLFCLQEQSTKVQKFWQDKVKMLRKMVEEQFEGVKLIFLKHPGNEKPIRE